MKFFEILLFLIITCEIASVHGAATSVPGVVDQLPPHQLESGLVTQTELDVVHRWIEALTGGKSEEAWLDGWLGKGFPFSFKYNGKSSESFLASCRLKKTSAALIWTDEVTGLRVTWQMRQFSDFPALDWVLWFENTSKKDTPIIEDIQALDLHLNHTKEGSYTVHGLMGGSSMPDDMCPFDVSLTSALTTAFSEFQLETRDGSSSYPYMPFFNLETPEKRGVFVGIGWSSSWKAQFKAKENQLNVKARILTANSTAHFLLHPGEKVRSPRILVLPWEGERLHGHNMFRRLLHTHYIPRLKGRPPEPLVSLNTWYTHHMKDFYAEQADEKGVLPYVKPSIDLGVELFIIDAGWYEMPKGTIWYDRVGDFRPDKTRFPRGFRPISDPLRLVGIPFGLWFTPENAHDDTPLVMEHPDWMAEWGPRMDLPEFREWFLNGLAKLVKDEGLGCYRQDSGTVFPPEPENRRGIAASHHNEGFYALLDEIIKRFPDFVMEGCAGGGTRVDLETISRFHWYQKSDRLYDAESNQCGLYGANLFLPGGYILVPTDKTDDYGAWSSFAGQLCVGWDPPDSDFPMKQARQQIDRYKKIRPFLSGDFYPLTPYSFDAAWIGYQFHRTDLDKGFGLIFHRSDSYSSTLEPSRKKFRLALRGLVPEGRYRVHLEGAGTDVEMVGAVLAEGIDITCGKAPTAEMVIYERLK